MTGDESMNLKQRAYSSVRWTAIGSALTTGLRLVQVAVLARILSPDDYGLFAIVLTVLGLAAIFSDIGLNVAYVQRDAVTDEQRSSLFFFTILLGGIVAGIVASSAPLFARYFHEPRLISLIPLSAVTIFVNAFGSQLRSSAEKNLQFNRVITVEVVATVVGFLVGLIAALVGLGVYSLVLSAISTSFFGCILAWKLLRFGWTPSRRMKLSDVRPFIGFGSSIVGTNLLHYWNSNIDLIVGARFLSADRLGIYNVPKNIASQLIFAINPIITRVGFPLISKVQRNQEQLKSIYLKTLKMTAATIAPLFIVLMFWADEITAVLLGTAWADSAELLRVFALGGAAASLGNPLGSLLNGTGNGRLSLLWNAAVAVVLPVCMLIGAQWGALGLCIARSGFMLAAMAPAWMFLVWPICAIRFNEYFSSALVPFLLATVSGGLAYFICIEFDTAIARLLFGIALSGAFYVLASYAFNRAWLRAVAALLNLNAKGLGRLRI